LNDSLARFANSFYSVGSEDLTKILAVFLETSKISSESNVTKYTLEKNIFLKRERLFNKIKKLKK
jgi:hypothetical protein